MTKTKIILTSAAGLAVAAILFSVPYYHARHADVVTAPLASPSPVASPVTAPSPTATPTKVLPIKK